MWKSFMLLLGLLMVGASVTSAWGDACKADLNGDGVVDFADFMVFGQAFGKEAVDCTTGCEGLETLRDSVRLNMADISAILRAFRDSVHTLNRRITLTEERLNREFHRRITETEGELRRRNTYVQPYLHCHPGSGLPCDDTPPPPPPPMPMPPDTTTTPPTPTPDGTVVLSLDLIPNGGSGNQQNDGVTSGTVSGQGTKIAIEVFATGVTTPLSGMLLQFDFDASLVTFDKAENSTFTFSLPQPTGTGFAATSPVTLPLSGFLARAEFTTATDVTGRAFSIGLASVTLSESPSSSDTLTTTTRISFNTTP